MKRVTTLKDVFAEFGRVAHQAQLIEHGLVSLWMMESITQGFSVTRDDLLRFQQDWSAKTIGQLLRPLLKSGLIPAECEIFMEQLRVSRNRLVHSFFLDDEVDLQTDAGLCRAAADLRRIWEILTKGQEFFAGVLDACLKDYGIDPDAVRHRLTD